MTAQYMRDKFKAMYCQYMKVPGIGSSAYRQVWTAFSRRHLQAAKRAGHGDLFEIIDLQVRSPAGLCVINNTIR